MHKHILDSLKKSDDYKMPHTSPSPDGGAPLHDMTQVFPSDIYSKDAARYYPHGSEKKMDRDSIKIIQSVKGNPEAKVFVHRAVPKDVNVINPGDWVSINKDYAKEHGENKLDGNYHILSQEVPAKEIYTSDSIHEQGWHPTKMQKSESEEDSKPKVSFSLGLGKHRQLRHFLSHEPEQKASKQKLKENGFDVQQMGYNPKLDSKGFLHHDHVHNKIENEPKMSFEFGLGRFNHENVPDEAKQYYHRKNFKPEDYNVSPDDEEGMNNAITQHMESFDPEKDHSQRHSDETSQVFHLNATPEHIQKMKDEGVYNTFQNMMDVERRSGHPNQGHTVGWVRFTHDNHEDPNKSGYHMDEIQNDLSHSWIDQTVAQVEEGLRTKQITPLQAQRIHDNATKSFPDEHLKKINDILFEGHHPNDVLHESFLQHLRDKGESGKQIHLWQAAPKAKMSDMDTEKALPGHMTHTYHKSPSKMGYKPSVYGELATQNGEHFGEPTWKHTLVKKEDYQSNAKKGLMLSFPAKVNGNKYRPDMNGIHYHSTIRSFGPEHNTPESVFAQAGHIDLQKPHEDTPISFGQLQDRNGNAIHAIFLHGQHAENIKEYRNKLKDNSPDSLNQSVREGDFKPHISVDKATWLDLKNKNPKTIKEAGIEFGDAEIHKGSEKTHSFGRIEGELHKNDEGEQQSFLQDGHEAKTPKMKWFGESKIKNHDGTPKTVYHGTDPRKDFDTFDVNQKGSRGNIFRSYETKSQGNFFAHSPEQAKKYGDRVIPVHIRMEKPLLHPEIHSKPNVGLGVDRLKQHHERDIADILLAGAEDVGDGYKKIYGHNENIHVSPEQQKAVHEHDDNADHRWIYNFIGSGGLDWHILDNPKSVNRMMQLGYDGTYTDEPDDEEGSSIFTVHPHQVKSVDSENFDINNPEFRKSEENKDHVTLYRGLTQPFDEKHDTAKTDAPRGYSTWTDSPDLARQYAGKKGDVYSINIPKHKIGNSPIDENPKSETYGDRHLAYFNDKPAGLHGVKGKEFLVYHDHEDYSPKMVSKLNKSESFEKQTLLNKLAQTTEKRKLPCGQIGFLMHRGMDNQEYSDNHSGGQAKYKKQILDWTPNYQKAKIDADKVVSAWIPENSVLGYKNDSYMIDSEGPFYHAHPEVVKKNMFVKD